MRRALIAGAAVSSYARAWVPVGIRPNEANQIFEPISSGSSFFGADLAPSIPAVVLILLLIGFLILFRQTVTVLHRFSEGLKFLGAFPKRSGGQARFVSPYFLRKPDLNLGPSGPSQKDFNSGDNLLLLLEKVTSIVDESSKSAPDEIFSKVVTFLCDELGMAAGQKLILSESEDFLISSGVWVEAHSRVLKGLYESRREEKLPLGHSLSGQVWSSGEVRAIGDIKHSVEARRFGMGSWPCSSVFSIPVKSKFGIHAVIELYGGQQKTVEGPLLKTLALVGRELGRIYEREIGLKDLSESEARFQTLSLSGFEAIIVHLNGRIVEANAATEKITGYAMAEIPGMMITDFIVPEGRDEAVKRIDAKMESEEDKLWEYTLRRKDGSETSVECMAKNITYRGQPARVAIFRDTTDRIRSIEALRESEERFRNLSTAAFEGVVIQQNGIIVEANDGFIALFGHEGPETVIGRKAIDFVIEEDRAIVLETVRSGYEGRYEVRGIGKAGKQIELEVCGKNVRYHGKPARVAALRDITERKRALMALQESEDRFRLLSDSTFEAVVIHRNTKIVEVNQAFLEMFGYSSRDELIGLSIRNFFAPPWRALVDGHDRTGPVHHELEMLRRDGRTIAAEVRVRAIPYEGGMAQVATIIDITERKRTEEMLKERETRLTVLVEQVPAILWSTDSQLRFVSAAGAGLRLLNLKPNDLLGKTLAQFFQTSDPSFPAIVAHRRALLGESLTFELNWGSRIFEAHVEPLQKTKDTRGTIGVALDVTERKASEEKLRTTAEELIRSNRELEQFAYVASHDLQEPLRMIASYVDLLSRRYKPVLDAEAGEFIAFAVDGAKRMKQQIDDLLTYSRVNRTGTKMDCVDTSAIVDRVLLNLRLAIEESKAKIEVTELPEVVGDAVQLTQLFQNLISNALKFRQSSTPSIRISAQHSADSWIFSIEDNGIGIDTEYHERIFLIFQRLHSVSDYPGTGIGLAICKKIVERHGGKIWVDSASGQGSVFRFTLRGSKNELGTQSAINTAS